MEIEGQVYHKYENQEAAAKKGHWKLFSQWAQDNDKYIKDKLDKLDGRCSNLKFETKMIPEISETVEDNSKQVESNFKRIFENLESFKDLGKKSKDMGE